MQQTRRILNAERGLTLTSLIAWLVVLGMLAVLALKIAPAYAEYRAIRHAMVKAKEAGGSVAELRGAFDKHAQINNVSAISGRDLVIARDGDDTTISFAYEKRVPLMGNVSLVIDYAGSTDPAADGAAQAARAAP